MTPSLPTFSMTSAIRLPISWSWAEMAATVAISSLVVMVMACALMFGGQGGDALLDAALEQHGVGAGGHVLQAFGDDGLGQHGRGGGAVAGDVVGLGRGFLQKLRAHVLERILQLDFLGHGHAVVRDGGGAPFLVQGHVAALGAEGGLDGLRQGVNADLQAAARFVGEKQLLSHG